MCFKEKKDIWSPPALFLRPPCWFLSLSSLSLLDNHASTCWQIISPNEMMSQCKKLPYCTGLQFYPGGRKSLGPSEDFANYHQSRTHWIKTEIRWQIHHRSLHYSLLKNPFWSSLKHKGRVTNHFLCNTEQLIIYSQKREQAWSKILSAVLLFCSIRLYSVAFWQHKYVDCWS